MVGKALTVNSMVPVLPKVAQGYTIGHFVPMMATSCHRQTLTRAQDAPEGNE
jgi:hypothetical protein